MVSNCETSWAVAGRKATLKLHALQPIAGGDELTINYMPDESDMAPKARHTALRKEFGFTCVCQTCLAKVLCVPAAPQQVWASEKHARHTSQEEIIARAIQSIYRPLSNTPSICFNICLVIYYFVMSKIMLYVQ